MFCFTSCERALIWRQGEGCRTVFIEGEVNAATFVQASGGQLRESEDPLDLLDPATARAMHRTAAGQPAKPAEADFPTEGGKMIIREDDALAR